MILYPYQNESVSLLSAGFREHKRQVLALTTGGGKTVIFTEIAKRAVDRGKIVLILTHRTELFNQAHKTFGLAGLVPTLINAKKTEHTTNGTLFVAMVETIARRTKLLNDLKPDLIIIDECHIGNFTKIMDAFPDVYTLGVTATPIGKHFHKYYTNIVQTIDTPDLVERGFLSPCIGYQMVKKIEGIEKKAGEYTEKSQFDFFDKSVLYDGVIDNYKKFAQGKKTLIFNCNIEHSEKTAQSFNDAGIESYSLTSKNTTEERLRILKWFESTPDAVLNNNGILTAGYDHPPIECIIVNRATASLPLWLQMCGRGSRISNGKTNFIVLDFGANHSRHGMWQTYRKWDIDPPKEKAIKEAPIKECPRCCAVIPVSLTKCNFCGYEYPISEKQLQTDGEMELFVAESVIGKKISELTLNEVVTMSKSKKKYNVKTTTLWRFVRSKGEEFLMEYAKKMDYKYMWIVRQKEELENNKYYNTRIEWKN